MGAGKGCGSAIGEAGEEGSDCGDGHVLGGIGCGGAHMLGESGCGGSHGLQRTFDWQGEGGVWGLAAAGRWDGRSTVEDLGLGTDIGR